MARLYSRDTNLVMALTERCPSMAARTCAVNRWLDDAIEVSGDIGTLSEVSCIHSGISAEDLD